MSISANRFVTCSYDLYVGLAEEKELMEQATAERPLCYIHGMGMMLPEFEKHLFGLAVGDKFDFELKSEDAYGERQEDAVLELPKDIFKDEEGRFDSSIVYEGNTVPMRDAEGNTLQGSVLEVRDDVVVMDFNHRLAGENLNFIGEIIEEREATAEEIEQFFGGHSGCGCGCSCESESSDGCRCGSDCGCH